MSIPSACTAGIILVLYPVTCLIGAEPPLTTKKLDGVTKIRLLPPGADNPRNSEGDFVGERTRTLEDDPNGWYCYTAVHFVDGHVLLGHCAGDRRTGGLNTTQITRFPVDWLYGKD